MATAFQNLQSFSFDDELVRVVMRDGEPWFVAADACRVLGIQNVSQALENFDDDEKGIASGYTLGGQQQLLVVSEPGLYRLIFMSRKPNAKPFQRWVRHDVLPSIRRTGRYEARGGYDAGTPLVDPRPGDLLQEPLLHRLHILRECRAIHGRAVAALMWRKLGLPDVPPPPPTSADEARLLLRTILDAPAYGAGERVRDLIARALEEDEEARLALLPCGIRVFPDRQAFVIGMADWLRELLKGTEWAAPMIAMRVLRRLPGTSPSGPVRMGQMQPRGTTFSGDALDEEW